MRLADIVWAFAGAAIVFSGAPATAQPHASTAAAPAHAATAWPLSQTSGGGTIVVYEPQVRAWPQYRVLSAIAAVAVTLPGAAGPAYGTLALTSFASADVPASTVTLLDPQTSSMHWPNAGAAAATSLDAFVKAHLRLKGTVLPLTMVMASLPTALRPNAVPPRVNPPVITVSRRPAELVVFDGAPSLAPIPGTALTYATNTTSTVVFDSSAQRYYLLASSGWLAAATLAGPWAGVTAPASFAQVPNDGPWDAVRSHLTTPATAEAPQVVVSTQPAALVVFAGSPQFADIPNTQLRYVTNTSGDVFFSRTTTLWYVLVAGRWFSANNLNGPWAYASGQLPADFRKIPANGPRGRVLSAVPGTTEYFYAGSVARAPHVEPIDPAAAALTVTYGPGDPSFQPIAGTSLRAAVNTPYAVIEVSDGEYFACEGGLWYAASSPLGPWKAATYVPAVIYTIPASSPLYRVTFVHIYDARGRARTAPPKAAAAAAPEPTYQNFSAGNFSAGDAAGLYSASVAPYYGGNWAPFPVTNYNDSQYAYQARRRDASLEKNEREAPTYAPGHGAQLPVNPKNNVYAADDGSVYIDIAGAWKKRDESSWGEIYGVPPAVMRDRQARRRGYRGTLA